ncbi:MAG: DUF3873 family protein [Oscillospiraceae bacterium]
MKRYFMSGEECSKEIAETTDALNLEILNEVSKSGDMNRLVDVKFIVCVATAPAGADLGVNEARFECFTDSRGRSLCQFDYRDFDGELFSCVKPNLGICIAARDTWLTQRMLRGERKGMRL